MYKAEDISRSTLALATSILYHVLTDQNVTRTSTPSPTTKLPSLFFPPRYAAWTNSRAWLRAAAVFCATSLQQWARRYLHQGRMGAFFAGCVDKVRFRGRLLQLNIGWAVWLCLHYCKGHHAEGEVPYHGIV